MLFFVVVYEKSAIFHAFMHFFYCFCDNLLKVYLKCNFMAIFFQDFVCKMKVIKVDKNILHFYQDFHLFYAFFYLSHLKKKPFFHSINM